MKLLLTLLLFVYSLFSFSSVNPILDSLLNVYHKNSAFDTSGVYLMKSISDEYLSITSFDSTNSESNKDSAFYWCDQALSLSIRLGFIKGEAQANYQKGRLFLSNNEYSMASGAFHKARRLYTSLKDKSGIADCYVQAGVLMYVQKNFKEALKNFRIAASIYNEDQNQKRAAQNQYLSGLTLYELGDYKSALPELISALAMQKSLNQEWESMQTRMALAHVYYKTGNYTDALILYRYGLEFFSRFDNAAEPLIICNTGIGNVFAAQDSDLDAEKYYMRAFDISKKIKRTWRSLNITEALFKLYEKRGDFKKAFEFQNLYHEAQDSLYNEQNMQVMADLKSSLDIAKKQTEIDHLNQQEKFDKKLKLGLAVISALLIAWLIGLWRSNIYRRKIYNKLELKNKELNETLLHLKSAETQLIKAEKMAVFGKLSAGIAHEIRNPLNFITNFSELSEQIADDFVHTDDAKERMEMAQQLKKLVDKIGYHGRRADSIVTRMLQHSRTAHTELELTDVNNLANEFSDLAYESMRNLITNFECRLEKKLDPSLPKVWLVPQDLSRVIINLLNNAFYAVHDKKHMQLNGYIPQVTISTSQKENKVILSIHDNGSGIPAEVKEKIFEPFFTTKPMGEGTGLGLSICADIIKAAHGEISVESSPETGTEFHVVFPSSSNLLREEQRN